MALDVGGEHDRAAAAYRWLAARQRADGSWASEYRGGVETAPAAESNHAGYLAVGAWHSWLTSGDEALLTELWPAVRRGLDLVTRMQLAGGAIGWALRPDGTPDDTALLTGNASLFQALRCGIALAGLTGEPQPDWELAVTELGHRAAHPAGGLRRPVALLDGLVLPGARRRGDRARRRRAAGRRLGPLRRPRARHPLRGRPALGHRGRDLRAGPRAGGGRPDRRRHRAGRRDAAPARTTTAPTGPGYVYPDDDPVAGGAHHLDGGGGRARRRRALGATPASGLFPDPGALPPPGTADGAATRSTWLPDGADPVLP